MKLTPGIALAVLGLSLTVGAPADAQRSGLQRSGLPVLGLSLGVASVGLGQDPERFELSGGTGLTGEVKLGFVHSPSTVFALSGRTTFDTRGFTGGRSDFGGAGILWFFDADDPGYLEAAIGVATDQKFGEHGYSDIGPAASIGIGAPLSQTILFDADLIVGRPGGHWSRVLTLSLAWLSN